MVIIAILGIIMAISPKSVAKKSMQESKARMIVIRIMGIVAAICAIFALILLSMV
ncbi:MAG: hypothetical protein HFH85_00175 [Lachnospiraceae bacterium]|nr:hypothetical protein [Lachnospiraceae bacterium]